MTTTRAPTRFFVASVAAHLLLAFALIHTKLSGPAETLTVFVTPYDAPKPKPPPKPNEPPKPEPPKPHTTVVARAAPKAAPPPPTAAPPPPSANPNPAPADAPDFSGLGMMGGPGGDGPGVAVNNSPPPVAAPVRHIQPKVLQAAAPKDECADPPAKPSLQPPFPMPVFPPEARAAGITGKVKVRIYVDDSGAIEKVEVISGLGHGCDEAALEAAKSAHFQPALHCGKAVAASIVMGFTF